MKLDYETCLEAVQDFLFPMRTCALCHQKGHFITRNPWCEECEKQRIQETQEGKLCRVCQREIPEYDILCKYCKAVLPPFLGAVHLGPYLGIMEEAVKNLKYHNQKVLAVKLGALMVEKFRSYQKENSGMDWEPDVLVPVPLHPDRERFRGYNQSALLVRQMALNTGWKMDLRTLVRVKNTSSQTTLDQEERCENMRGAFRIQSGQLQGKKVLLVDDVFTTGATVRECTEVLLAAGTESVWVMTLAAVSGCRNIQKRNN